MNFTNSYFLVVLITFGGLSASDRRVAAATTSCSESEENSNTWKTQPFGAPIRPGYVYSRGLQRPEYASSMHRHRGTTIITLDGSIIHSGVQELPVSEEAELISEYEVMNASIRPEYRITLEQKRELDFLNKQCKFRSSLQSVFEQIDKHSIRCFSESAYRRFKDVVQLMQQHLLEKNVEIEIDEKSLHDFENRLGYLNLCNVHVRLLQVEYKRIKKYYRQYYPKLKADNLVDALKHTKVDKHGKKCFINIPVNRLTCADLDVVANEYPLLRELWFVSGKSFFSGLFKQYEDGNRKAPVPGVWELRKDTNGVHHNYKLSLYMKDLYQVRQFESNPLGAVKCDALQRLEDDQQELHEQEFENWLNTRTDELTQSGNEWMQKKAEEIEVISKRLSGVRSILLQRLSNKVSASNSE